MISRTLLGPQRNVTTIGAVLTRLDISSGSVCTITAGWQEREGELEELERDVGRRTDELRLYHRAEEIFSSNPHFRDAYHHRQGTFKELQRLYRRRLAHAFAALAELMREPGDDMLILNERRAALRALRTLDRQHLRRIDHVHAAFEQSQEARIPTELEAHRNEVRMLVKASSAVLIAGGHVELLLNRLRLFDLGALLKTKPIIAWSAGAMALSERVVLFHDNPPQGAGIAEVADRGLGLFPGVLPLPHAGQRLRLHDSERVSLFARRFAPARCTTLEDGSALTWKGDRLIHSESAFQLTRSGGLHPVKAA